MNEDNPNVTKLYALSREANQQEQALIDEFYIQDWQDIKSGGRLARYWKRKTRH